MRKSFYINIALLAILAVVQWGCRDGKRASLQDSAALPDKTLFENGVDYLDRNQFIKARLSFQTLINAYDESPFLERSKYYIAYSFMREGGVDNLLQAEQAFRDFRLFFPTSDLADDAQAYIVEINMKMMHAPNRDLKYTQRAEGEINRFLVDFPNSSLREEIELRRLFVQDVLATSLLMKGQFYHKRKQYKAAVARLRDSVSKYRNFGRRDHALFLLADALDHVKNFDESATYYAQVAQGYPFSEYFSKSKDRLKSLEKPIPDVDARLAEENRKTYYKSDSILTSPFKSIFGTIGIGDEDPMWAVLAKQRTAIEQERIKADAGKTTEGGAGKKKKSDKNKSNS